MPIKMWINGYYRSGTTILFDMVRESKPNGIHLCEPFHPKLEELIYKYRGKPDPLHGIPLWDDYFKLPSRVLDEILETSRKLDGSPPTVDEVCNLIDMLNDLNQDVYIKTVRGILVLPYALEYTDAMIFHVYRCPACVWLSHFDGVELGNLKTVMGINPNFDYHNRFYLGSTFKKLARVLKVRYKPKNYLEVFTFNYRVTTNFAMTYMEEYIDIDLIDYNAVTHRELSIMLGILPDIARRFDRKDCMTHHDIVFNHIDLISRQFTSE